MKFDTIHHVALICSDYKASRHFDVDLLGFEIIRENYREKDVYKRQMAFHRTLCCQLQMSA